MDKFTLKEFHVDFFFSLSGKNKRSPLTKNGSKETKPSSGKRKQYSTAETASLEAIFKSTKGHPSASIIQRTAESLEIGEDQVKNNLLS